MISWFFFLLLFYHQVQSLLLAMPHPYQLLVEQHFFLVLCSFFVFGSVSPSSVFEGKLNIGVTMHNQSSGFKSAG